MKKRFLSLLMALCLMLTLAPAAFAADANDLQTRITNATAGDTIILSSDETISTTLTIDKAITIDGQGQYAINYTGASWAVSVTTDAAVAFKDMDLNATATNARGILLNVSAPNVTLDNVTLSANVHGMAMAGASGSSYAANITVKNGSIIQNSQLPSGQSYETWAKCADARGISLWDVKGGNITIEDSTIQGFGYTINLAGTVSNGIRDFEGTKINVDNSSLMGWTAFNVWCANAEFNITNSTLKGINTSNGNSDGFAAIVVNDNIYGYEGEEWTGAKKNIFNIAGGTITSYRSGIATEQLFRIDNQGITEVNFLKYKERTKVAIIDGTGDSEAVFYSGYEKTPDDWADYMNKHVHGNVNCTLTGYNGATLSFIPA